MKRILITGATSGIGRELAVQYVSKGYIVGLTGRRTERLQELRDQLGKQVFYRSVDVRDTQKAEELYKELITEMGGMDVMILNAGVGIDRKLPDWEADEKTIAINVMGFAHGAHVAFHYFLGQGHGQIVSMSSIASLLASGRAASYTASKHFVSNYMTGFRQRARRVKADITITDIKPGFIWTEMTQRNKSMFWVADVDKAVAQMIKAIEAKKNHAYITKRWRLVAWAAKLIPQFVWDRI